MAGPWYNEHFYRNDPRRLRILRLVTIIILGLLAVAYLVVVVLSARRAPPSLKTQQSFIQSTVPDIFIRVYLPGQSGAAVASSLVITWQRTQANSWRFVDLPQWAQVYDATANPLQGQSGPPDPAFAFFRFQIPAGQELYWAQPDWLSDNNQYTDRLRVVIQFPAIPAGTIPANSTAATTVSTARFAALQVLDRSSTPMQFSGNELSVLQGTAFTANIVEWLNVSAPDIFGNAGKGPVVRQFDLTEHGSIASNYTATSVVMDVTYGNNPEEDSLGAKSYMVERRSSIPSVDYLSIVGSLGGVFSILMLVYRFLYGNDKYTTWGVVQNNIMYDQVVDHTQMAAAPPNNRASLQETKESADVILAPPQDLREEIAMMQEEIRRLQHYQNIHLDTDIVDMAMRRRTQMDSSHV